MTIHTEFNNTDLRDSLLTGDKSACSKIIHARINEQQAIKDVYENTIKPTLYEIGELWEFNKISVATEHLASAIIEATLNELYPQIITTNKNNKSVIVSCLENEFHQIGIKMVSDIFELKGWNSYFLGANTPSKEIISLTEIIKPDILAISLSIYSHLPYLENTIKTIREKFPNLLIIIGGQAFRHGGQDIISKYTNVEYLPDLNSIDLFIDKI